LTKVLFAGILAGTMSQDRLIRLVSKGEEGAGKNEVYYTSFNNKNKKDPSKKLTLKKYSKKLRKHVDFTQKK